MYIQAGLKAETTLKALLGWIHPLGIPGGHLANTGPYTKPKGLLVTFKVVWSEGRYESYTSTMNRGK